MSLNQVAAEAISDLADSVHLELRKPSPVSWFAVMCLSTAACALAGYGVDELVDLTDPHLLSAAGAAAGSALAYAWLSYVRSPWAP